MYKLFFSVPITLGKKFALLTTNSSTDFNIGFHVLKVNVQWFAGLGFKILDFFSNGKIENEIEKFCS